MVLWHDPPKALPMPLQNRVQPTGEIITDPARGLFTGNRGIIHTPQRSLGTARWSHHAWICCVLDWQGRKRPLMTGRNWTELFFLDEAVAIAAGHRPCGYCRRADYIRFVDAWADHEGRRPKAPQMDKALHAARIVPRTRTQLRRKAMLADLPQGAMILRADAIYLVQDGALHPYLRDGYGPPHARRNSESVTVLTPEPMLDILRAGYRPVLHASAGLSGVTAT
jgi:hypothetical protein